MRRGAGLALLVIVVAACSSGSEDPAASGTWVGTVTTEGDVTTVMNESGSVWGGTARLLEEVSIGVEVGDPAYMLGRVASITADDARIYVLDRQPPLVRVYDHDGNHLLDMGGEGEGPGEFNRPSSVVLIGGGRVVVRDDTNGRFSVFAQDGALLDTWTYVEGGFWSARRTVVALDGNLYRPELLGRGADGRTVTWGYARHSEGDETGEPITPPDLGYEAPILEAGSSWGPVPLTPRGFAELAPTGWLVGIGDVYRFEAHKLDGTTMVIERRLEPVPVSEAEQEWETLRETAFRRSQDPSWSWDAVPVPATLPAFADLYGDADGRTWVRRYLPSARIEDCTEERQLGDQIVACWRRRFTTDVFGPDGRYLGEVESPRADGILGLSRGYVRGDMILLQTEDEAGTIMVKRYRLVLPGEE